MLGAEDQVALREASVGAHPRVRPYAQGGHIGPPLQEVICLYGRSLEYGIKNHVGAGVPARFNWIDGA